jgi:hypothetical protein
MTCTKNITRHQPPVTVSSLVSDQGLSQLVDVIRDGVIGG